MQDHLAATSPVARTPTKLKPICAKWVFYWNSNFFLNWTHLQHQKNHEKALGLKFICFECNGLYFESSTKLNVHKREHHFAKGGSSWCQLCNREFTNLRKHEQVVHERIRPFSCDIDGKGFAKMHGLIRHIEAVHLNLTPFSCSQCTKKFKEASALRKYVCSNFLAPLSHKFTFSDIINTTHE